MIRIVDLTLPLVPGMRGVSADPARRLETDGWNATTWHLYSHAGTHMDAPVHFGVGSATVDQLPIGSCLGPAWVVDMRPCPARALLTPDQLGTVASRFRRGESLLLRTGWSTHANDAVQYRDRLPRISDTLATWCVEHGVRLLGVEPPSVADVNDLAEVIRIHRILLEGGVTIVEGLAHLDQLGGERILFGALPLLLAGSDGSPVRAFAIEGLPPDILSP